MSIERIARGISVVHIGCEYSLRKAYDRETGFERVVGYYNQKTGGTLRLEPVFLSLERCA